MLVLGQMRKNLCEWVGTRSTMEERTEPDTPQAKFQITEMVICIANRHISRLSSILDPTVEDLRRLDTWRGIVSKQGEDLTSEEVDLILKLGGIDS